MKAVLQTVQANPCPSRLDEEIDILVAAGISELPTHMIAIHNPSAEPTADMKRKVTLYPVHNVVLASQCSNLPPLPLTPIDARFIAASQIHQKLPVVHLGVPHPDSFPLVKDFLYTQSVLPLLAYMLPFVPAAGPFCSAASVAMNPNANVETRAEATQKWKHQMSEKYASQLAEKHTAQTLLNHCIRTYSLYRNVVALGISNTRIWEMMDMCWEILIVAITRATGRKMDVEFA